MVSNGSGASSSSSRRSGEPPSSRLAASLNHDERKMDRLTASKSMFEKDKFAESLAKVVF